MQNAVPLAVAIHHVLLLRLEVTNIRFGNVLYSIVHWFVLIQRMHPSYKRFVFVIRTMDCREVTSFHKMRIKMERNINLTSYTVCPGQFQDQDKATSITLPTPRNTPIPQCEKAARKFTWVTSVKFFSQVETHTQWCAGCCVKMF